MSYKYLTDLKQLTCSSLWGKALLLSFPAYPRNGEAGAAAVVADASDNWQQRQKSVFVILCFHRRSAIFSAKS
jgi:hypothetical protein